MKKSEKFIQRLKRVRKDFPELSEDAYLLVECISSLLENQDVESMDPSFLFSCVDKIREQLIKSEYDQDRRVIGSMIYIPHVIEQVADPLFSARFKKIWDSVYGPYRFSLTEEYPEHVKAAVEWWGNCILSKTQKEITDRKREIFQYFLADGIIRGLFISSSLPEQKSCDLVVDDEPCYILYSAGRRIGLKRNTDYPFHTTMHITPSSVSVEDLTGEKIIWQEKPFHQEKQK